MVLITTLSSVVFLYFFNRLTPKMHVQLYFWFAHISKVNFECADCVTGIWCQWSVATIAQIVFLVLWAGFLAGELGGTHLFGLNRMENVNTVPRKSYQREGACIQNALFYVDAWLWFLFCFLVFFLLLASHQILL